MARSLQRRNYIVQKVALYFAQLGFVPTEQSYVRASNRPFGIKSKEINKWAGGWNNLLILIEENHPDLWKKAQPQTKAKASIKPKAKAKPATKVASKKEK
jgi:hypothetical protein